MSNEYLDEMICRRNKRWKELEGIITTLVKEHYRLLGRPYYEPTAPELEPLIKGGDDGKPM